MGLAKFRIKNRQFGNFNCELFYSSYFPANVLTGYFLGINAQKKGVFSETDPQILEKNLKSR